MSWKTKITPLTKTSIFAYSIAHYEVERIVYSQAALLLSKKCKN